MRRTVDEPGTEGVEIIAGGRSSGCPSAETNDIPRNDSNFIFVEVEVVHCVNYRHHSLKIFVPSQKITI